jgi:hypothetical protein
MEDSQRTVTRDTAKAPEPEWKASFRKAKNEAEAELREIHREAAARVRERLRRAS